MRKQILKQLRKNSRKSISKIAREEKIATTTVFEEQQKLEKIIHKHTTIVDFRKLGFGQRNLLFVKAKNKQALFSFLSKHPNINNFHKVESFNFGFETVFANMKQFYDFLEQLEQFEIEDLHKYELIEDIKREEFLG
ncbi:MAG: hypothetical protein ABIC91_04745 [Nanoarchaeota archaeon]|nr:hypothetical protein [Nanoarchaeota archaeon]MBU1030683.1 hypothetical protein [Nanoarchaeota archaeon]MBU1849342.1 hypothetical protein [Nanoarchaeota archaeon]